MSMKERVDELVKELVEVTGINEEKLRHELKAAIIEGALDGTKAYAEELMRKRLRMGKPVTKK